MASTDPYVRNFYKVLKTKIEKKIKSADRENAKLDSTFFKELNEMKFCFRLYVKKNVIEAKQKALLIYWFIYCALYFIYLNDLNVH